MLMLPYEVLKNVDFGDIDGLYDKHLSKYFFDENYWEKIIDSDVFYVIGRKGTGKSAIYRWIYEQQAEKGVLVSNLSFKEFPFEKLLKLSDDNFSKPNQYQSIWRNIILSEIAKLITIDQNNVITDEFKDIKRYVDMFFGKDIVDLHKQIILSTEKKGFGIEYHVKGNIEVGHETSYGDGINNITNINRRLELQIRSYLKQNMNNKYIIQFDQLDDNYSHYSNSADYFQSIISLFKTIYDIDQTFRSEDIPVKVIAYLRSDIFYSINNFDAESARWDKFKYFLNWSIIHQSDWENPRLLQLLNKRISVSIPELNSKNPFNTIFNSNQIRLKENDKIVDVFKYIIHRTFHRPRDIVQFCIKIQDEVIKDDSLYFRTIKNAEKEYSLWLLSELSNELSPIINDLEVLYEFLRLFGQRSFSMNDFKLRHKKFESSLGVEPENLLKMLYSFGIIYNINYASHRVEIFTIIRNDRSVFNRDLKIQLHPGFYSGLYVSKFLKR